MASVKDVQNVLEQHSHKSVSFEALFICIHNPVDFTVVQIITIYVSPEGHH